MCMGKAKEMIAIDMLKKKWENDILMAFFGFVTIITNMVANDNPFVDRSIWSTIYQDNILCSNYLILIIIINTSYFEA